MDMISAATAVDAAMLLSAETFKLCYAAMVMKINTRPSSILASEKMAYCGYNWTPEDLSFMIEITVHIPKADVVLFQTSRGVDPRAEVSAESEIRAYQVFSDVCYQYVNLFLDHVRLGGSHYQMKQLELFGASFTVEARREEHRAISSGR